MTTCTRCGASWKIAKKGFYTWKGIIQQPCKECRKNRSSQDYCNNRFDILEARYQAYHAPENHKAKAAYFRDYRRAERQQDTA